MNTTTAQKKRIRTSDIVRILLCLLGAAGAALAIAARSHPDLVESYYSTGFYPVWAGLLIKLTSWFSFSLAELLIIALIAGGIVYIVFWARAVARSKGKRLRAFWQYLFTLISAGCAVLFLFMLSGGLNYYRYTFTYYSGLEPQPTEIAILADLSEQLVAQANELREGRQLDENGVFTLDGRSFEELADVASCAYAALGEQYPRLFELSAAARPKRVFLSEAMSYMQIVGVWLPYTAEPNINVHCTDYNIPDTMCHELSHISGFMREDEANFIAYLACMASGDPDFMYSATLAALINATNALYSKNRELYYDATADMSDGVRLDLTDNSRYWDKYDTSFGDFSTAVNNTYLQANNQTDGVASYGRMVDLLIAKYKKDNNIA